MRQATLFPDDGSTEVGSVPNRGGTINTSSVFGGQPPSAYHHAMTKMAMSRSVAADWYR
jgi:hypothetical protein